MFLIILLFLSFIFCVTILIMQKCRSKKMDQDNTTNDDLLNNIENNDVIDDDNCITHHVEIDIEAIIQNAIDNPMSESEHEAYNKKREELRENERLRAISNNEFFASTFLEAILSFETAANFYDLDKAIESFNNYKERLSELKNYKIYIAGGIREYNRRRKELELKTRHATIKYDSALIEKYMKVDYVELIDSNIPQKFEAYWDKVLSEYKRPSAYFKRLAYLVKYTSDIQSKDYIAMNDVFLATLKRLNKKYSDMYDATQNE